MVTLFCNISFFVLYTADFVFFSFLYIYISKTAKSFADNIVFGWFEAYLYAWLISMHAHANLQFHYQSFRRKFMT